MTLLLLGDSHGRILSEAAGALGLPLLGGFIGSGRRLNCGFYRTEGKDVRFLDSKLDSAYRAALTQAGVDALGDLCIPVVCLFGTNLHYLARAEIWAGFRLASGGEGRFLSTAVARATFRAQIEGVLAFHSQLADWGIRAISVLPPRRFSPTLPETLPDIFMLFEDMLFEELQAVGTQMIDHRHWSVDESGSLRPEYANRADSVHGSLAYGLRIVTELFAVAKP